MKINYYNLNKDKCKRYSQYKKKKALIIWFNNITIVFENSDRGFLLWIITLKIIKVFGYWKQNSYNKSKKFYQSWTNDHYLNIY